MRGKGRVVNLPAKHCRKSAMIVMQKQMMNKADWSAHGKENSCGHALGWRFGRKTAGRIDID